MGKSEGNERSPISHCSGKATIRLQTASRSDPLPGASVFGLLPCRRLVSETRSLWSSVALFSVSGHILPSHSHEEQSSDRTEAATCILSPRLYFIVLIIDHPTGVDLIFLGDQPPRKVFAGEGQGGKGRRVIREDQSIQGLQERGVHVPIPASFSSSTR